jgi:hypothetical protein
MALDAPDGIERQGADDLRAAVSRLSRQASETVPHRRPIMFWRGTEMSSITAERLSAETLAVLSRRLRTALALYDSGIAMKRAQLRRQHPTASEEEIKRRLTAWLRTRPGAPFGDAEGTAKTAPDSR